MGRFQIIRFQRQATKVVARCRRGRLDGYSIGFVALRCGCFPRCRAPQVVLKLQEHGYANVRKAGAKLKIGGRDEFQSKAVVGGGAVAEGHERALQGPLIVLAGHEDGSQLFRPVGNRAIDRRDLEHHVRKSMCRRR